MADAANAQETIATLAERSKLPVSDFVAAVEQLGLRYEPSRLPLGPESFVFASDVLRIRQHLGILTVKEQKQWDAEELERHQVRFKSNIQLAVMILVAIGLAWLLLPGFIGWLAGTNEWRGRTAETYFTQLFESLWWLVNTTFVRVVLVLVVLFFGSVAAYWSYMNPPSKRGRH